jgi:large subunit ribosomal protein L13
MKREKIVFDASGEVVGRLATKIAMALMGKNKPDFQYHIDYGDKVQVLNVSELRFTGKKMATKEYKHHSMHPGGLKIKLAKDLIKADPKEMIIHAVSKMLPKNKTRSARLQRISFK